MKEFISNHLWLFIILIFVSGIGVGVGICLDYFRRKKFVDRCNYMFRVADTIAIKELFICGGGIDQVIHEQALNRLMSVGFRSKAIFDLVFFGKKMDVIPLSTRRSVAEWHSMETPVKKMSDEEFKILLTSSYEIGQNVTDAILDEARHEVFARRFNKGDAGRDCFSFRALMAIVKNFDGIDSIEAGTLLSSHMAHLLNEDEKEIITNTLNPKSGRVIAECFSNLREVSDTEDSLKDSLEVEVDEKAG